MQDCLSIFKSLPCLYIVGKFSIESLLSSCIPWCYMIKLFDICNNSTCEVLDFFCNFFKFFDRVWKKT